ncbi:MAG: NAD(P)/FAD-dependent oxidoreductase [Burkholderiales bacterium]
MSDAQNFEVVVIGGGVAGLTAGLFSARLGRSTLVLESLMPGGHLGSITKIDDYPGFPEGVAGYDLGPMIQEQAANAGAEFQMGEMQSLTPKDGDWSVLTSEGEIRAKAVIVATGSTNRLLGVPGEERLTGKGVSHCASCDGPMLKGKKAVVIGAGDSGLQEALTLTEYVGEVLVFNHLAEPSAQAAYQTRVREHAKIKLQGNTTVEEIVGEQGVSGVRINANGTMSEIACDAVFVYIGLKANTDFLKGIADLDENGRIRTDINMCASAKGLFAAGDVRAGSASQAITSAGDGATAAIAADRYLKSSP